MVSLSMMSVLAVCLTVVCLAASALGSPAGYTTKFDNINVDNILNNDRLLNAYVECLMERGKCTPDGEELKNRLSDALQTDCVKCSAKQKVNIEKMVKFLLQKKPKIYEELEQKYDTKKIFREKYGGKA